MTRRPVLALFAKEPVAGSVKTRMTPPLSAELSAELYTALLDDTLEASIEMAKQLEMSFVLFFDPPDAEAAFCRRTPAGTRLEAQRGGDLGARLAHAAGSLGEEGFSPIFLRGSDSPLLDKETLHGALEALETADLVLCPDCDGGYNLIGVRRPEAALFELPMSTDTVLENTLEVAEKMGLRVTTLPPGYDLDRVEDLRRLARDFARGRSSACCPRTRGFLQREELQCWIGETSRSSKPSGGKPDAPTSASPRGSA